MKKLSLFLGMALAASLSLTNCTEKIEGPIAPATPAGIPFEISADISTKTTNDGLATKWVTGDAINLFHAVAGTTDYVSDNDFKLDATRDGVFTGNLASALDASQSYDWYAIYPYNKALATPANNATTAKWCYVGGRSNTPAVQNGNNSTSHLVERYAPLWGKANNVASNDKPSMTMQHLASVVAVKVTNTTEEPLTINSVAFTSTEPIVGQFYIDVTGTAVEYTTATGLHNSSTASLTVNGATPLANGESALYYIPIKPHTAAKDKVLTISVNGYEKPLTLPKDVTFTAGKIKTLAFNYNKVVVDYVTLPWTEDFSGDLSLYTLVKGDSDTKTYNDKLAGGTAPELLIGKNKGSFSARVKADAGNYVLTFKSNKPENLTVLSSDAKVTVVKESNTEYLLTIPEGGSTFSLTIKNTNTKDNARIDDISLVADTAVRVPVITVDNTNVSVKAEGDIVTLKYSIKYPAAGATISAASTETWVNTFEYKDPGEITFAVDANEGDARTATITLSYPDAAPVAVTISQRAAGSSALVDKTATIKFGTNDVKIDKASVTANDDQKNSWTITTVGTDSFTPYPTYYQIGSKNSAATSITFTTTLPEDAEVTSISAKFGGNKGTAGTITLKVGEASVGTGKLNAGNDVTVTSTSTAVGNKVTITVTGIAKGVKCYNIQVKYKTAN